MDKAAILSNNEPQFLVDLKRCREIMIYAPKTDSFFKLLKREVVKRAEKGEIRYYVTDKIFVSKRDSMVIL